ncbi:1-acyl-sn-glycerol-3-phosphate acyltransferase [Glaciihabitans tibetensis]|uniref:1-acyl-sn-glycerol-3-phosphate acyltransferase n=1 Tax=Glaciihabitans tibetensis TaxID=1266600 RepID=A0A2T0VGB2_9MICO|nr:lysophospholipid acyltransferase family protein [Glaciihabitans tibetensis]PRY69206.1 1-acyl-sn-glycerol-3-phosphate acyltransferase [Glaciihabitans tibetensis]
MPPASAMKPARSEKTPIFRFLAMLLLPLMNVLARYVIHNPERVPKSGAFVLAPNHFSEIDPVVIGLAMWRVGRMPRYLAKASLFKIPVAGWLLRRAGQIPVERAGTRGSDPLTAARKIAHEGLAVVVYPEGTLTRDPDLWPMRGKTGAVRIALQEGIPIIPAAHWGTQLVMPRYAKRISLFPRKTVHISFGDPVDLSAFAGRGLDTKTLTEATEVVMQAVTALVAELRGEPAPAVRWDPAKHQQTETGRFE